jgi:hypothetical protein
MNPQRRSDIRAHVALLRSRRQTKQTVGVISIAQWTAWSQPEKSKVIDQMWQIKGACESLGAAWHVVRLLTRWGYTVEWVQAVNGNGEPMNAHWCDIRPGDKPKVALEIGIGWGPTLSESLCAAALRSVELLALR